MPTDKESYVRTAAKESDMQEFAQRLMDGQILLLKLGTLFALTFNPSVEGLEQKLDRIKGRRSNQHFTLICNYGQALELIDRERINIDFFNIGESFGSKAILRVPLKVDNVLPFPYNRELNTVQYVNIQGIHPLLNKLTDELARLGCRYLSTTSGNLHGEPTTRFINEAETLAIRCNERILEMGITGTKVIVVDIPGLEAEYKGSFPILSFLNPGQVEVIRNIENNPELTRRYIQKGLEGLEYETVVAYLDV